MLTEGAFNMGVDILDNAHQHTQGSGAPTLHGCSLQDAPPTEEAHPTQVMSPPCPEQMQIDEGPVDIEKMSNMTLAYVGSNVQQMDAFLEHMRAQQVAGQQRTLQIMAATVNVPTARVQPEVERLRLELEAAKAREKIYSEQVHQAEDYIRGMRQQAQSYKAHVETSAKNLIHHEQSSFLQKAEEYKARVRDEYAQAWREDQQRAHDALGTHMEVIQQEAEYHRLQLAEAADAHCERHRHEALTHTQQLEAANRQLLLEAEAVQNNARFEEAELVHAQALLSNAFRAQRESDERLALAEHHAVQQQHEARAMRDELHERLHVPPGVPIIPMHASLSAAANVTYVFDDDREDRKTQAMVEGITDRLQQHSKKGRPSKIRNEKVYRTWAGRVRNRKRYCGKKKPGSETELEDVYNDLGAPPPPPLFRFPNAVTEPWPSMSSVVPQAPLVKPLVGQLSSTERATSPPRSRLRDLVQEEQDHALAVQ